MMKLLLVAAAMIVVIAQSAPAAAAPRDTPPDAPPDARGAISVAVPIAGLDLASDAGVATLMRRVRRAADKVCGGRPSAYAFLEERRAFRVCRVNAIGAVVAALEERYWTVQWAANPTRPFG